jgi:hypothetical protein
MPRKSRSIEVPAESRPFAADTVAPFASLSGEAQSSIASAIAADKAAGLSGNDLRAKFGEGLTGPARRKVLRKHGFGGTAYIARSYDEYRDGDSRKGTEHAREHGPNAGAKLREAAEETFAAMPLADVRAYVREAGEQPVRVRGGNEQPLREQAANLAASNVAALLAAQGFAH